VNQFFASRNTDGTFKEIGFARVVKPIFCHCVLGRVDVVRV
jgi:hypothetical protein